MKKLLLFTSMALAIQSQAQNVGIGNPAPAEKLDVTGNINLTGTIKANGVAGANGQVLTSTGNALAWSTPVAATSITYYPTVWICCNPWATKNLNVTTYRNGDPIPQVTDPLVWRDLTTGAWCYYNNNPSSETSFNYGKLYNWYAVNDPRGLAPEGWHIPTESEWQSLGTCLGGNSIAANSMRIVTWDSEATNFSGFTATPGGWRVSDGSFYLAGDKGHWWTSSSVGTTTSARIRSIGTSNTTLFQSNELKTLGLSVRLVRD